MSPTKPARLWFMRHGETAWSLSGQHTSRTDLALTARGEAAATALGQALRGIDFAQVLTSPRLRARRTCDLAGLGANAVIEPDLREWEYGAYEGRTSVDIRAERPGWHIFRDGCPGGEAPADIAARADRLIARLSQCGGNIALFAHGQFGAVLAVRWIGLAVAHGENFPLSPASLSILAHGLHDPSVRTIECWNTVPIAPLSDR